MITPSTAGRRDSDDRSERHFEALAREQCLDLLESNHVGRVAWQAADLPQILPVTYAMHQGSVYFRTTPDWDPFRAGPADQGRA
jgi:nitroimidazol reductase NimA-like FMN-containing flavoprotein (pyridoxamine 5'-phosphate oxidase superfamily)